MLFGGTWSWSLASEQLSYPIAPYPIQYRLAIAVLDLGTYTEPKKLLDDLALCCSCFLRPCPTPACVLDCEMKRGRSRVVLQRRIPTRFQQDGCGRRASR